MLSLLGLTFLPSAFEIDQGLEKFQNPKPSPMSMDHFKLKIEEQDQTHLWNFVKNLPAHLNFIGLEWKMYDSIEHLEISWSFFIFQYNISKLWLQANGQSWKN